MIYHGYKRKIMKKKTKVLFSKDKNYINSSNILISGSLITCIILSVASGFIDLTFFSGLSKSLFHVGTIPIAASILYTVISIGFISGKFWCAMKIGMLKELKSRLKAKGFKWAEELNKILIPWHIAHKFLIIVSIITALSLSVNSIGSGVRTIEQTIKNMTADANELIELNNSYKAGVSDKRTASKDNITNQQLAKASAKDEVATYWGYVEDYRIQRDRIQDDTNLTDDEKETQIATLRKRTVNRVPKLTSKNIDYISRSEFETLMKEVASSNEVIDSTVLYEEAIAFDKQQIEDKIKALEFKGYKNPDGTSLSFVDDNGEPYDTQVVISLLQSAITKWQAPDAGDVGESSKIFTLIATYVKANVKAGGMGTSEWMMIILIALFGIVQEFLIAIYTPKAAIDRKLLSQVSQYLFWQNKNEKEKFLISVYEDYVGDGIITKEDFEEKCKKCVEIMSEDTDSIIQKYSKKPIKKSIKKEENGYSEKVDNLVKEIEDLI